MADVYTGISVFGLFDNNTEAPLFGATGSAVPTSAVFVGGSDGTNLRAISVDATGKVNVNATITPPSDTIATGTLTNPADTVVVSTTGTSALMVNVALSAAITAGNIIFEVSTDGTNWTAASLYPVFPDGTPSVGTVTTAGNWQIPVGGVQKFRTRASGAFAGGPATITLTAGQGQYSVVALSDQYGNFLATSKITDGTNTAAVTAASALKVDGSAVTQPVSGTVTANQGTSPWVVSLTSTTITGTVAVTQSTSPWVVAGNKTNNNAAPNGSNIGALTALANAAAPTNVEGNLVLLSVDLAGNLRTSTTISGTVAVTQSTSPWVVSGTVTANAGTGTFRTAPDGTIWALTGTSANVDVTNTVTVTGTVAVTQSTSPWVVAGNLTNNNAAPAANNSGVLGFEATNAPLAYTTGNQVLGTTSLGGAMRVVPVDEENAASISYFSVDTGVTQKSLANATITPIISIQSNSAAFIFRVRQAMGDGGGTLVQWMLVKNPQTLTGSAFTVTGIPSGSHIKVDTTATAITIGTGTVVWSAYSGTVDALMDKLILALAAGTPGDTYTIAAQKVGTGTSKVLAQIGWSEQAAAL